ncbi:hypothetical protein PS631_00137 [Pseudomonas fluorescens]|uniref:O-antigen ligase domain-containing protein n=1 Tax=Pseudomonas fluorescens TaxID=294 RepID=A0A5E6P9T5_PSEFL|nr:O-antigen ligase family protein [Pseudomonas fluorescens]VVM38107.1 hypothetical protein PS631_00137 [Pseudomonas fluorescens]
MRGNTRTDDFGTYQKSTLYSKSSTISVIMLLPAFFLYQILISYGVMPPFAGGYFTAACLALLPLLTITYFLCHGKRAVIQTHDFAYFAFLIYFATIALSHRALGAEKYLLEWHLISSIQMASMYLAFKGAFSTLNKNRKLLIFLSATLSTLVICLSSDGAFNPRIASSENDSIVSYQGFALSLFLMSCLSIFLSGTTLLRVSLYGLSLTALYLNGARSEFAGFLIFSMCFEFFRSKSKPIGIFLLAIIIVATTSIFLFGVVEIPSNRVTNLLNLESDNSSNIRNEIATSGIEKILQSPLTGSYGDYEQGLYIHNIFSSWQDLGLIGFIFFCLLITVPIASLLKRVLLRRNSSTADCMILSLLISAFILLIFGKYFTYLVVPAVLGLYSGLVRSRSRNESTALSDRPDSPDLKTN